VRVVNKQLQCIGYRLNLLGVRVYRHHAQLVARSGGEWVTIGPPRELPIEVPSAVTELGLDTLLLTASQYSQENPGTDLTDVLSLRKDFDAAIRRSDLGDCDLNSASG
jgi:hypothetical protein